MHSYNVEKPPPPAYSRATADVELTGMIMEQKMMMMNQQQRQQMSILRERRDFVRLYIVYSLIISCVSIVLFGAAFLWMTSKTLPDPLHGLSLKITPILNINETTKNTMDSMDEPAHQPDTLQPNFAKLPFCLLPRNNIGQQDFIRNIKSLHETIQLHSNLSTKHVEHINSMDLEGPFTVRGELFCKYSGISVLKGKPQAVEMCNTKLIWQLATLFEYVGFKHVEVVPNLSYDKLISLLDKKIARRPGFFMEVGLTMSRRGRSRGRWFPHNGGHMINVDFWRDQNLDLKFLIKDYQERPFPDERSEGNARFSVSFPDEASQFDVLLFPEQVLDGAGHYKPPLDFNITEAREKTHLDKEYAQRLQAIDFRAVKDDQQEVSKEDEETDTTDLRKKRAPLLGCYLCSLAAFKSKTVSEMIKELQQYEEPPPSDPIVNVYHRQGVENLQLSVAMNKQEYLDHLRGQVSSGEVVHLDLVYWPRDFNQLTRVHVQAWKAEESEADTDQLRVLVNQFEEPVDSPDRFYDWIAKEKDQPDDKTRILWYYDFKISY